MLRRLRGFFFFAEETDMSKPKGSDFVIFTPFRLKENIIEFLWII